MYKGNSSVTMAKIIVISLFFTLGTVRMTQAKIVSEGGLGRLNHGEARDGTIIAAIYSGVTSAGSFASNTFESFENLCACLRCNPHLLDCVTTSASTLPLKIPRVIDITFRLGECCKLDLPSHKTQIGGDVGGGLLVMDTPRNSDALVNELGYGVTDRANDALCSLLGTNFLSVHLFDSCPGEKLTPDALESKESFCEHFRNADEDTQQCLSDAAIDILLKLKGIDNFQFGLGTCCARCPGKNPANPPPPCKSNPPVATPKC